MSEDVFPRAKEPERYVAGCATWFGPWKIGRHGHKGEPAGAALTEYTERAEARWFTQRLCLLPYKHDGAHQGPEFNRTP